jgi:hypothetical protein
MRMLLLSSSLLILAVPAWAQQSVPPANPNAHNPAINSPNSGPNPGAPAEGANSFTEGQAKSRIEAKGFSNISGLRKDASGVWRGTAMKGGKQANVSVDFQGNVVAQ